MQSKHQREKYAVKSDIQAIVNSICESVRIDSSRSRHTHAAPFGQGALDCLLHFLSLAERMGFVTRNYDNYIGEVEYGEGKESFAILCHLDVVPAGTGWTKPPFGGVVEDGKIWGRGTMDDKGPAICCLYALNALKEEGFVPRKKIKLIVGCNEEDGWGCVEHYKTVATLPETGFSPDAEFPVIYAEKGILHVRLHFPLEDAPFTYLEGGKSANMVCDLCVANPRSVASARWLAYGLTMEGKKLYAHGKSAHGSTPDKGRNAIRPMLAYFAQKNDSVQRVFDCLFNDIYGLTELKDETGKLTLSPNVIKYRKHDLQVLCDIRYPATMPVERIFEKLASFGVKYETVSHKAPLMNDRNGELVRTLLSVFEECTGRRAKPVAIGGGTYARALRCGAGFGPELPGDETVVHQADEYISLDRVDLLFHIYKRAIERLTE